MPSTNVLAERQCLSAVTTTRFDASIDRLVPKTCKIVWVPLSEDPDQFQPQVVPLKSVDPSAPMFYPVVALGGTFDHLHAGHKILLSMGAWIAKEKLIVGITGPFFPVFFRIPERGLSLYLHSDDSLLGKKQFKEVNWHDARVWYGLR